MCYTTQHTMFIIIRAKEKWARTQKRFLGVTSSFLGEQI